MSLASHFLLLAVFLFACRAKAETVECAPGKTAFTLTTSGGDFVWRSIHLSLHSSDGVQARGPVVHASLGSGPGILGLDTSVERAGIIRLASNIKNFEKTINISIGKVDLTDILACTSNQINLVCEDISFLPTEKSSSMKCSLDMLDADAVITP